MPSSEELFERANAVIPGGVNSPVRACRSVNTHPLFIESGAGSRMVSVEGDEYIDFVMSWGPLLLGHAHPEVVEAAKRAADKGSSFGAPCTAELELAETIVKAVPGIDMVRLVNSGTEATMSALRVARAATGRNKVLKFIGCYHGHVDSLLAQAGSGLATLSIPGTPGVPAETAGQTLQAPFNDAEAVREIFQEHGQDIAAVIIEPVAGNMGLVPPENGFLQALRSICDQHGSLLIFDEVISGFRMAYGGAQEHFGVLPDLTCLGKIIGGGYPVGAFGGRKDVMEHVAPCGSMYQAGTLAGNPVAMAAGLKTLQILANKDYTALAETTNRFAAELANRLEAQGVPVRVNCLGSAFTFFFTRQSVTDFESAKGSDQTLFQSYYSQMRQQGIYLAPSNFECTFTSFAHTREDLEKTLHAASNVRF
jgi:glutamate-1-semialdehyde 2,1-aminomutase